MKILYVHGYNGDPYGDSFQYLKSESIIHGHEMYTIDYDPNNPMGAIFDIFNYIKENKIDLVIGASLGGFLTMNLFGIPRIVVNPCWDPAYELPLVGYTGPTNIYTKLLDTLKENLDFEESNLCFGIFDEEDELLGTKYVNEFDKYFQIHYMINAGGHKIYKDTAKILFEVVIPDHIINVNEFVDSLMKIDNAPWLD